MSANCQQPLDEVTVQVWLLYLYPNLKYCTLYVGGMELWSNEQTDNPLTRYSRARG